MGGSEQTLIGGPVAPNTAREPGDESKGGTRTALADSGDVQSLLADALRRLAEATGSGRACAWARRADGEPYLIAATYRDATAPESPDAAALETLEPLFKLDRPIDLGAGLEGAIPIEGKATPAKTSKALAKLAVKYGLSSAMPLISTHSDPVAMVLLGSTDDPPGNVRPRTLAALDAAVTRLRAPAAAAASLARLTNIDAEVCRLDRLAVLGDMLTEVAHEIRNPLVSMKTFLHLLPDHLDDAEFQGEFRGVVLEELQRMERLLDTLLEHAQPRSNRVATETPRRAANLESVFESLNRLLEQRAAERSLTLSIAFGAVTDDIAIDIDALRQVLLNLVLNALEAAPESTTVTLRAEQLDHTVVISVEDEGDGVPEALRARLFEPFFSTREDRSGGLGLAITKKLIEDADGSIRIEDANGGGALFRVELPRVASPQ